MPWDPYYKVESEVATMMLADSLGIPTPRVFFFDSSARNPLGLECMFMERVGGISLFDLWAKDPRPEYNESYTPVASQVKDYLSRLWEHSFDLIGSVYYDWDRTRDFFIGPVICVEFATPHPDCLDALFHRGPFTTWQAYAMARAKVGLALAFRKACLRQVLRAMPPAHVTQALNQDMRTTHTRPRSTSSPSSSSSSSSCITIIITIISIAITMAAHVIAAVAVKIICRKRGIQEAEIRISGTSTWR